jgi:hypothetical protein
VKLPAGAAARVWVLVAGDEALGVRRGVELPEAFLRADRSRQTNRMVVGTVAILVLVGFMITSGLVVKRRLTPVVHDGPLDGRTSLRLVAALFVLGILSSLNSLPSQLSSYETAEPWSTFLGTTALGFLEAVVYPLILIAMFHVLDALRRRLAIPMLPAGTGRSARTDMLIMGLGLGGATYAMSGLDLLLPAADDIPSTPWTHLDDLVPFLSGVPDLPGTVIGGVAMLGIPILVVAGLTRRPAWRALMAVALLALVTAIGWSFTSIDDVNPYALALLILILVLAAVAIRVWGSRSGWVWFVAVLFFEILDGLRDVVYGVEWQARVAGALICLLATALIALIMRRAVRQPAQDSPMEVISAA